MGEGIVSKHLVLKYLAVLCLSLLISTDCYDMVMQIESKQAEHVDERVDSLTLYSLLSSSTALSKRNISIILEQVQHLSRYFLCIEISSFFLFCYYVLNVHWTFCECVSVGTYSI